MHQSLPPEIITCFNIIDEQDRPLNLDGVQPTEIMISRIGSYPGREYPTTDIRIQKLENIYEPDYLTTQPKEIVSPFTKRYIYNSSRDFRDMEILVLRVTDERDDTMRIIFTGQNKFGNPKEPVAFVIDDIRFQKGSYVMNCEKNLIMKKEITFNNILRLNAYYIKSRLEIKKTALVPPTILKDYVIDGFTFYKNGLFDYQENISAYPYNSIRGHGVYELSKEMISLYYTHVPGRYDSSVTIMRDSSATDTYTINCQTFDKDKRPIPGVSMIIDGGKIGTFSGNEGTGVLKCTGGKFPLTMTISSVGYGLIKIPLDKPGNYTIKCILNEHTQYIDSGRIDKGVFTDFTKDYIGIYWKKNDTEQFSPSNQKQMDDRTIYLKTLYR